MFVKLSFGMLRFDVLYMVSESIKQFSQVKKTYRFPDTCSKKPLKKNNEGKSPALLPSKSEQKSRRT